MIRDRFKFQIIFKVIEWNFKELSLSLTLIKHRLDFPPWVSVIESKTRGATDKRLPVVYGFGWF